MIFINIRLFVGVLSTSDKVINEFLLYDKVEAKRVSYEQILARLLHVRFVIL